MQPDEFVPYLDYKAAQRKYQWIGAGRDSDALLCPLCTYWLERREEMASTAVASAAAAAASATDDGDLEDDDLDLDASLGGGGPGYAGAAENGSERVGSPPPARCPTSWTVKPSSAEEKESFRKQVQPT